jgi:hypothetical protein
MDLVNRIGTTNPNECGASVTWPQISVVGHSLHCGNTSSGSLADLDVATQRWPIPKRGRATTRSFQIGSNHGR